MKKKRKNEQKTKKKKGRTGKEIENMEIKNKKK